MVAMDGNPSLLQFLAYKLGKAMDRSITKKATRTRSAMQTMVKLVLHIVGFSCLTLAGFSWSITAGWVVAGLSCLVLSPLITTPAAEPDRPSPTLR